MLVIELPELLEWSDDEECFIPVAPSVRLEMEHSLLSIKEWEAHFNKAFFNDKVEKTDEELLYYIMCMIIKPKEFKMIDIARRFKKEHYAMVEKYMSNPSCGKKLKDKPGEGKNRGHIKGDLMSAIDVYYYMFELGIDKDCEKWHINMLMTLIDFTNRKRNPKKAKTSKRDAAKHRHALNAQRRAAMGL